MRIRSERNPYIRKKTQRLTTNKLAVSLAGGSPDIPIGEEATSFSSGQSAASTTHTGVLATVETGNTVAYGILRTAKDGCRGLPITALVFHER